MKSFLLALVCSAALFAQSVVTIASLRNNDANGVPLDTGVVFRVSGVVTSSNHIGASGPGSLQDATAGISVFGSAFAGQVQIGDSVTVTSKLTQFRGLTQFDMAAAGSSVVKHASGKTVTPLILTVAQVNGQVWNGFEEFESRLVRIDNVTISATGNFAGNTNYNITDATGTMQMRVDSDVSSIVGQPIPSGQIDLVGILGQFKSAAPFQGGYQLIPRFLADLVYESAPVLVGSVIASNIDTSSFTVYFNTVRKGNSIVKYGLVAGAETDSVIINNDTTEHIVRVTGLQANTVYYFRALSRNANGTSTSSVQSVTTASRNPQTGTIRAYFNYPVDTTVAFPGNAAKGSQDFQQLVVRRINAANYSIDMAVYSFDGLNDAREALINAKNRGVRIRIVYTNRAVQAGMQALLSAGILMSQRPTTDGLMHNKFLVFDGRDSIPANDWVWTGSWNLTTTELNWKNNVLEINDQALARAYTLEFEEMWGSTNETPNPSAARFGSSKLDNTPHSFTIGGRSVLCYFSPSDLTTSRIAAALSTANFSNYFATYSFTRADQSTAMKARFDAGATDVKGIIDNINDVGSEYTYLQTFADVRPNTSPTLHHKYAIVDASYPNSVPTVITGSHNWSAAAETKNDENTLIIRDFLLANQFMQEFKKRYNENGGTGTFVVPVNVNEQPAFPSSVEVMQNYPNPFNPVTTIRVVLPESGLVSIVVFNALGQQVRVLYNDIAPAGLLAVDFKTGAGNLEVPSGIYFYKVTSGSFSATRKMILMK